MPSIVVRSVLLLWALMAGVSVHAQALRDRYPAGSLKSEDEARVARDAAEAAADEADARQKAALAECAHRFFVNRCEDQVRHEHARAAQEARSVRVEANDVIRAAEAQRRANARGDVQGQSPPSAGRADTVQPRPLQRPADERDAERKAHQRRLSQHAEREKERAAKAAQADASRRAYDARVKDAEAYAKRRAEERERNEKRRAERQKEREEDAARRAQP